MYTRKENLLRAMRGERTAFIPWVPSVNQANTPRFAMEYMKDGFDMLKLGLYVQKELSCDLLINESIYTFQYRGAKKTVRHHGPYEQMTLEKNGHCLTYEYKHVVNMDQEDRTIIRYPIQSVDDLMFFEELLQDVEYTDQREKYIRVRDTVGDLGIAPVCVQSSAATEMLIYHMGCIQFNYILADEPELLTRVIGRMDNVNEQLCRLSCESGVDFDVIACYDDHDILTINPRIFNELVAPGLKRVADVAHAYGKLMMMHDCGHIRPFLGAYPDIGLDAHHFLSTAPMTDLTIQDAKRAWGDRITIMAAVNTSLQALGTADEVKANVEELLAAVGDPYYRFALMSPLKPDIPTENILAIRRVLDDFAAR